MKCPRCDKKTSLIFSYVKRNGLNEYTKKAFGFLDRRKESVILRQYQCHHDHGLFLHRPNKPLPEIAFIHTPQIES